MSQSMPSVLLNFGLNNYTSYKVKNQEIAKRVKILRNRAGLSQELLAENSGLSLRTIQRIETGVNQATGDTIKKLANALNVTPNELIDWQIKEDNNALLFLNLSQLGFLAFPLLNIIIPLIIWISKKDKIKDVDRVGKSILNFQITWTIAFFLIFILAAIFSKLEILISISISRLIMIIVGMYLINILIIVINTIKYHNGKRLAYKPAIPFLR